MLKLRPHHSLCMQFFIGKGYSPAFTKHMYQCLDLPRDCIVEITFGLDELCQFCPNHPAGICDSQQHVHEIDTRVANRFHYVEGTKLTLGEFWDNARSQIIEKNQVHQVCGDCAFLSICLAQCK